MSSVFRRLRRPGLFAASLLVALAGLAVASPATAADAREVRRELNDTASVRGTDAAKSWRVVFDAYLDLSDPPMPVGQGFNHTTIHPGMPQWDEVASWAESNPHMADAVLEAVQRTLFGLPYGVEAIDREYAEAGLYAEPAVDDDLRESTFAWLEALDRVAAYVTAETYRRLEAGEVQEGLDLAVAGIFFLRQCCDREFMFEVFYSATLLNEALANLRDVFYLYLDRVSSEQYTTVAAERLPFLRPDRNRLLMPEGDRIIAEALIESVFDDTGIPDRDKFGEVFGTIQAQGRPFTRFGAVRRWRAIADVHDSKSASLERLTLVYDDWWRRWRVEEYDPILSIPTEFSRTNPIRYAAVIYSMQDIEDLFALRNELQAQTWGTAMAAGICGYLKRFGGAYPTTPKAMYAVTVRKSSDRDPFDQQFGPFHYEVTSRRRSIETAWGVLEVPADTGMLWSNGRNLENDQAAEHTENGLEGDLVLWPPVKAMLREQGLRR